MSIEKARAHLRRFGRDGDIREAETSTATVPEAAKALGVEQARIAKSLSIRVKEDVLVLVTAGDVRVDNKKFKARFGKRPRMLTAEEVSAQTGFQVGGVCPFGLPENVAVYLDESLLRFQTVFPACGTGNSLIELTPDELNEYSLSKQWVDVCIPYEA
jgi:prolyl-tRNA editing enzyme YbaK/EbsC (Cys-tRNA(Pro) deacylase)